MNLFCKKNGINYYMDNDSIINICSHNEEYLGNSFIMLKARVYDNLVENLKQLSNYTMNAVMMIVIQKCFYIKLK